MNHHRIVGITVFILLSIMPFFVFAQSLGTTAPVGGKVLRVGKSESIVCAAMSGPIFLLPFNIAIPGPFFIRFSKNTKPKRGGYLLGNYNTIPDMGTCYNPETGAPIPAFELRPYGASK